MPTASAIPIRLMIGAEASPLSASMGARAGTPYINDSLLGSRHRFFVFDAHQPHFGEEVIFKKVRKLPGGLFGNKLFISQHE